MRVVERPDLVRMVVESLHSQYSVDKPLPHLTELIYCLTRGYWDRLDPLPPTDGEILLWVVGLGLESALLSEQGDIPPGVVEGIHYTPDFQVFNGGPGELKTTRMSASMKRGFPGTWLKQIKGYCYGLGVDTYTLAVLFLMGYYRPPFPELKVFEFSFDSEDIEMNWLWLLARKALYLNAIENEKLPAPGQFNEDWECDYCRYKLRCDVARSQIEHEQAD